MDTNEIREIVKDELVGKTIANSVQTDISKTGDSRNFPEIYVGCFGETAKPREKSINLNRSYEVSAAIQVELVLETSSSTGLDDVLGILSEEAEKIFKAIQNSRQLEKVTNDVVYVGYDIDHDDSTKRKKWVQVTKFIIKYDKRS
jgi:hypothetical protein